MKRFVFFVCLCAIISAMVLNASTVVAQKYPDRPVQLIIGNVPGSIMDINARAVTEEMGRILGTQVIVVNKPGAASVLGTAELARSKKDGYTIGYVSASGAVYQRVTNPETVPYDLDKDLEPLGLHVFVPLTIAVQESSPWKTFKDLVEYAKKDPGKLRVATMGVGGSDHFNMEIIQSMAGIEFTHVPFKGGESVITALLGGHVELCFDAYGKINPHVQSGKLRILLTSKKIPESPGIPTAEELGYKQGLISTWFGFFAPAGLQENVKKTLQSAVQKSVENPELKSKVEKMGYIVEYKNPAETRKLIKEEYESALVIAKKIGLAK